MVLTESEAAVAINPATDIVLDVARAAEPAGLQAAKARLEQLSAGAAARAVGVAFAPPNAPAAMRAAPSKQSPEAFVKFEAMVLQNFVQSLLPQDGSAVYGEGLAGEMWKTFMAQNLSETLAKSGGIGIADRILPDHYKAGEKRVPVGAVSSGPEKKASDEQNLLSVALVQEIQRTITRTMDEDLARIGGPEGK